MSGARLCATLADLGYEGWQLLDADSFEWPFQYEETRPLLNFLCTNLRPSNALTLPELLQYNELKAEGKLLEGEDLDFAYGSISAFASMRSNQEAILGTEESLKEIKEATAAYQSEALGLQKHIQLLQSRLESLGGQTSSLIQWRRARAAAASSTANNLLVVEEKLAARNLEMNTVLEKLSSSARELSYYHSGEEDGIFISFADLQPYTSQDQAYSKQLRDWFSKQFDVGPSRLVAELGKSKCSSEALDEVTNRFVKGDLERAYHRRFVELQRLRSIFGVSERQWVEAHVEKAKQQAVLLMAQSQATADQAHVHSDLQTLRRKQTDIGGELYALSRKEDKLLSEEENVQVIPSLCWDLAQLQDTYTLQGDYDLKVMRQEYYISQQKKFIGFLVDQLARHRFLQVASHLERKTTSSAYELLRLVEADLQAYTQITSGRIDGCVGLAVVGAEAHEHGAVDDRDTFLHRVRDLLSIHTYEQGGLPMYVSAPGLVQQILQLQTELQSLQDEVHHSLLQDKHQCLNNLCHMIQQMQQLLFASSTTAQPILCPWPLMKELGEMEKVNSQLSAAIEEVTREHREKAEIVKHHPHEVGRERQVFVDFFCAPDRLRNQVRELSARVKALQI